jgi:purine-nucleoside phosphorylase
MAADRDPFALAADAARVLAERTGTARHDVAVVLGSGWARAAAQLGDGPSVELTEVPGFVAPSAGGHAASVRSVELGGHRVLVFLGRVHLYEGHDPAVVAHQVRTAALAGCRTVVLTNGAGSLRRDWPIGQPVLVRDHINLTGRSPLTGPPPPAPFGPRFLDVSDLYAARLRELAHRVDPDLPEGVYVGFHGPQFETPAEVRMAGILGGDLVGMSTVLEAIAAHHMGMEVLGLSLATNLAAGISDVPLDGADVLAAGEAAGERIGRLLAAMLATDGIVAR